MSQPADGFYEDAFVGQANVAYSHPVYINVGRLANPLEKWVRQGEVDKKMLRPSLRSQSSTERALAGRKSGDNGPADL